MVTRRQNGFYHSLFKSDEFAPSDYLDETKLRLLASGKAKKLEANKNLAFNENDKTAAY